DTRTAGVGGRIMVDLLEPGGGFGAVVDRRAQTLLVSDEGLASAITGGDGKAKVAEERRQARPKVQVRVLFRSVDAAQRQLGQPGSTQELLGGVDGVQVHVQVDVGVGQRGRQPEAGVPGSGDHDAGHTCPSSDARGRRTSRRAMVTARGSSASIITTGTEEGTNKARRTWKASSSMVLELRCTMINRDVKVCSWSQRAMSRPSARSVSRTRSRTASAPRTTSGHKAWSEDRPHTPVRARASVGVHRCKAWSTWRPVPWSVLEWTGPAWPRKERSSVSQPGGATTTILAMSTW